MYMRFDRQSSSPRNSHTRSAHSATADATGTPFTARSMPDGARQGIGDVLVAKVHDGPFTRGLPPVLRLPIAHAEGRYQIDPEGLARLEAEGRIALRYCDASGAAAREANPNGSIDNIAGVYGGPRRNVLGLMPHPERTHRVENFSWHPEGWTRSPWLRMFENARIWLG